MKKFLNDLGIWFFVLLGSTVIAYCINGVPYLKMLALIVLAEAALFGMIACVAVIIDSIIKEKQEKKERQ